jgi:hypothetical protein
LDDGGKLAPPGGIVQSSRALEVSRQIEYDVNRERVLTGSISQDDADAPGTSTERAETRVQSGDS